MNVLLFRHKELLKKDILKKRALLEKELSIDIQVSLNFNGTFVFVIISKFLIMLWNLAVILHFGMFPNYWPGNSIILLAEGPLGGIGEQNKGRKAQTGRSESRNPQTQADPPNRSTS